MAQMGLGDMGLSTTVFKRKFRWTLKIESKCSGVIGPSFLKSASRPVLDIDETEINFLNAKAFIPGKGVWNTMEVTYLDANSQGVASLFQWLTSVYDFTDPGQLNMN